MYLARTALIGDTFQIELEFRNVSLFGPDGVHFREVRLYALYKDPTLG